MRNIYDGTGGYTLKCCNLSEVIDDIKAGEWFRTDSMDWYYRSVPFQVGNGVSVPSSVFFLHRVCVTSFSTKYTYFYKIIQDDTTSVKIYTKKAIEDKICQELSILRKGVSSKTVTPASVKKLKFYLDAIPQEIYLREGFGEKVKEALKIGAGSRGKKLAIESQLVSDIVDAKVAKAQKDDRDATERLQEVFIEMQTQRAKTNKDKAD